MIHLAVFGYLFVVLVGIGCLGITLFLYRKYESPFFLQFIVYFSAFTLFIFSYLFVQTYIYANITHIAISTWPIQISAVYLTFAFLLFAILHFAHFLVYERPSINRTLMEAFVSLVIMAGMILSLRINWSEQQVI